jgi:hypothetical protein
VANAAGTRSKRWAKVRGPAGRGGTQHIEGPFGPGRHLSVTATMDVMNAPWWRIKTDLQSTDTLSAARETDDDQLPPFVD